MNVLDRCPKHLLATLGRVSKEVEPRESTRRDEKRSVLISAAGRVLIREGLGACSARGVAREAGVSKSILHYYFEDMDELVHLGIAAATDQLFDSVRDSRGGDPLTSFWTALDLYIMPFQTQVVLWLDYWLYCVRSDNLGPIREIQSALQQLLIELLEPLDIPHIDERAHSLTSFALGTVMQQSVEPIPIERLRSEISLISGVPVPRHLGDELAARSVGRQ